MQIRGIAGMCRPELALQLQHGGRFVFFEYCISCFIFTLRRPTEIMFLPANEWGWVRGLPYTLVSLLLGWWGLPWGFIYTPLVLATNLAGGCDVTAQTRAYLESIPASASPENPSCDVA